MKPGLSDGEEQQPLSSAERGADLGQGGLHHTERGTTYSLQVLPRRSGFQAVAGPIHLGIKGPTQDEGQECASRRNTQTRSGCKKLEVRDDDTHRSRSAHEVK